MLVGFIIVCCVYNVPALCSSNLTSRFTLVWTSGPPPTKTSIGPQNWQSPVHLKCAATSNPPTETITSWTREHGILITKGDEFTVSGNGDDTLTLNGDALENEVAKEVFEGVYSCVVKTRRSSINDTILSANQTVLYQPLNPVANLRVKVAREDQIEVRWNRVAVAQKYEVKCITSSAGSNGSDSVSGSNNQGTCSGLTPGFVYTVTVATTYSGVLPATAKPITVLTAPQCARNLLLSTSTKSIRVSWDDPTEGHWTSFRILLDGDLIQEVHKDENRVYFIRGLTAGTEYSVSVVTTIKYGNLTKQSRRHASDMAKTKLESVQNVTAAATVSGIKVSWNDAMGRERTKFMRYYLECTPLTATGRHENVTIDPLKSYGTCTSITPGTPYNVKIVQNSGKFGEVSTTGVYILTRPLPPHGEIACERSSTWIALKWNRPREGGATSYHIGHSPPIAGVKNPVVVSNREERSYNFTGLVPGTEYAFSFQTEFKSDAVAVQEQLSVEKIEFVKTALHPVSDLHTTTVTTNAISVHWTHSHGNKDSYVLRCIPSYDSQGRDVLTVKVLSVTNEANCSRCTPGSLYNITVQTTYVGFQSVSTDPVLEVTHPLPPEGMTIDVSRHWIEIRWNPPSGSGVTSYIIRVVQISPKQNILDENEISALVEKRYLTKAPAPGSIFDVVIASKFTYRNLTPKLSSNSRETCRNPLGIASNINATSVTTSHITVSWVEALGYKKMYRIECRTSGGNDRVVEVKVPTNTSVCGDLTAGAVYSVTVTTVLEGFEDASSGNIFVVTVPKPPEQVFVGATARAINITWTYPPAGELTSYSVHHIRANIPERRVRNTLRGEEKFVRFDGLTPGENCTVVVYSVSSHEHGEAQSAGQKAWCQTGLAVVTRLQITRAGTTDMDVTWRHADGNVGSYCVTCQTLGDPPREAVAAATVNSSTCRYLTPGKVYAVFVTTMLSGFENATTGPMENRTGLAAVQNCEIISSSATEIRVRWDHADGNVGNYAVTCTSIGNKISETVVSSDERSGSCLGVTPGAEYEVHVTSMLGGFTNVSSQPLLSKTRLAKVINLQVVTTTRTKVFVSWSHAAGNREGYNLRCVARGHTEKQHLPSSARNGTCSLCTPGTLYNVTVETVQQGYDADVTPPLEATTVPESPRDLRLDTSIHWFEVRWQPPSVGSLTSYVVKYFSPSNHFPAVLVEKHPLAERVIVARLDPGSEFGVMVYSKSCCHGGEFASLSEPAVKHSRTAIARAKEVTVIESTVSTIKATWKHAEGNKDHYILLCAVVNVEIFNMASGARVLVSGLQTTGTCANLSAGLLYGISVTTSYRDFYNISTKLITAITNPYPPSHVSIATVFNDGLTVEWTPPKVGYFTHYVIEYSTNEVTSSWLSAKLKKDDNRTFTITRLAPGTEYLINVMCTSEYASGYKESVKQTITVTTVGGLWSIWGDWGGCSVTCGNGTQRRSRQCLPPGVANESCATQLGTDEKSCTKAACSVFHKWGPWSKCTVTCGDKAGRRQRVYSCDINCTIKEDVIQIETCASDIHCVGKSGTISTNKLDIIWIIVSCLIVFVTMILACCLVVGFCTRHRKRTFTILLDTHTSDTHTEEEKLCSALAVDNPNGMECNGGVENNCIADFHTVLSPRREAKQELNMMEELFDINKAGVSIAASPFSRGLFPSKQEIAINDHDVEQTNLFVMKPRSRDHELHETEAKTNGDNGGTSQKESGAVKDIFLTAYTKGRNDTLDPENERKELKNRDIFLTANMNGRHDPLDPKNERKESKNRAVNSRMIDCVTKVEEDTLSASLPLSNNELVHRDQSTNSEQNKLGIIYCGIPQAVHGSFQKAVLNLEGSGRKKQNEVSCNLLTAKSDAGLPCSKQERGSKKMSNDETYYDNLRQSPPHTVDTLTIDVQEAATVPQKMDCISKKEHSGETGTCHFCVATHAPTSSGNVQGTPSKITQQMVPSLLYSTECSDSMNNEFCNHRKITDLLQSNEGSRLETSAPSRYLSVHSGVIVTNDKDCKGSDPRELSTSSELFDEIVAALNSPSTCNGEASIDDTNISNPISEESARVSTEKASLSRVECKHQGELVSGNDESLQTDDCTVNVRTFSANTGLLGEDRLRLEKQGTSSADEERTEVGKQDTKDLSALAEMAIDDLETALDNVTVHSHESENVIKKTKSSSDVDHPCHRVEGERVLQRSEKSDATNGSPRAKGNLLERSCIGSTLEHADSTMIGTAVDSATDTFQNGTKQNVSHHTDVCHGSDVEKLTGTSNLHLPTKREEDACMEDAQQSQLDGEDQCNASSESQRVNSSDAKSTYRSYALDGEGALTNRNNPLKDKVESKEKLEKRRSSKLFQFKLHGNGGLKPDKRRYLLNTNVIKTSITKMAPSVKSSGQVRSRDPSVNERKGDETHGEQTKTHLIAGKNVHRGKSSGRKINQTIGNENEGQVNPKQNSKQSCVEQVLGTTNQFTPEMVSRPESVENIEFKAIGKKSLHTDASFGRSLVDEGAKRKFIAQREALTGRTPTVKHVLEDYDFNVASKEGRRTSNLREKRRPSLRRRTMLENMVIRGHVNYSSSTSSGKKDIH